MFGLFKKKTASPKGSTVYSPSGSTGQFGNNNTENNNQQDSAVADNSQKEEVVKTPADHPAHSAIDVYLERALGDSYDRIIHSPSISKYVALWRTDVLKVIGDDVNKPVEDVATTWILGANKVAEHISEPLIDLPDTESSCEQIVRYITRLDSGESVLAEVDEVTVDEESAPVFNKEESEAESVDVTNNEEVHDQPMQETKASEEGFEHTVEESEKVASVDVADKEIPVEDGDTSKEESDEQDSEDEASAENNSDENQGPRITGHILTVNKPDDTDENEEDEEDTETGPRIVSSTLIFHNGSGDEEEIPPATVDGTDEEDETEPSVDPEEAELEVGIAAETLRNPIQKAADSFAGLQETAIRVEKAAAEEYDDPEIEKPADEDCSSSAQEDTSGVTDSDASLSSVDDDVAESTDETENSVDDNDTGKAGFSDQRENIKPAESEETMSEEVTGYENEGNPDEASAEFNEKADEVLNAFTLARQEQVNRKIEEINQKHQAEMEEVKKSHRDYVDELKTEFDNQVNKVSEDCDKKIAEMTEENRRAATEAEERRIKEINEIKQDQYNSEKDLLDYMLAEIPAPEYSGLENSDHHDNVHLVEVSNAVDSRAKISEILGDGHCYLIDLSEGFTGQAYVPAGASVSHDDTDTIESLRYDYFSLPVIAEEAADREGQSLIVFTGADEFINKTAEGDVFQMNILVDMVARRINEILNEHKNKIQLAVVVDGEPGENLRTILDGAVKKLEKTS